jgi:hypothetical protein
MPEGGEPIFPYKYKIFIINATTTVINACKKVI